VKPLKIIGSSVVGLGIGIILFFYVFGLIWSGSSILTCVATGFGIFIFGIIARRVVGKFAYLPIVAICAPFLFFALGTMGGLREEPIAFLFWSGYSIAMLASGLCGAYPFPKLVSKRCKACGKP
jgi:hypothetical protein